MLRTPFFTKHPSVFVKNAPRPRWEAWFWKRHRSDHKKNAFRPPKWANHSHFCNTFCTLNFAKSITKINISCLWALLGNHILVYLWYCMDLGCPLHIFALLMSQFCEKMFPSIGARIGQICKMWCTCRHNIMKWWLHTYQLYLVQWNILLHQYNIWCIKKI